METPLVMPEPTDVQLIEMTLAGNRDAFGLLFARYLSMAQNIAQGIVHDHERIPMMFKIDANHNFE